MGAHFILWREIDASIELLNNHFAYYKTQTYPTCIQLPLLVFYRPKQLKQFVLIFLFNAYSRILNVYFYEVRFKFCCYLDFSLSICELDGVWEQIEYNLLEPFLVSFDEVIVAEFQEIQLYIYFFHIGFIF